MSSPAALIYNTVPGPFVHQDLLTATIGPAFTGALVNLILVGVASTHALDYYQCSYFRKDSWKVKGTVLAVLLLALLQSSFEFWLVYRYGCLQDRGFTALFTKTIVDDLNTLFVGIEGAIVQSFLALRAAQLISVKRYKIGFYTISFSAITVGLLGSIIFVVISSMTRDGYGDRALPLTVANSTLLWLIGASIADISVTVCLVYTLSRRINGFQASTDSMLKEVIKVGLQSASYTAVCATIPVILILSVDKYSYAGASAFAFPVPLSSLYAISLLMTLTSREKVSAIGKGETIIKSNFGLNSYNNQSVAFRPQQSLNIAYRTERHTVTEDQSGKIINDSNLKVIYD